MLDPSLPFPNVSLLPRPFLLPRLSLMLDPSLMLVSFPSSSFCYKQSKTRRAGKEGSLVVQELPAACAMKCPLQQLLVRA